MTIGLWQNFDRHHESYWSQRPGLWSHGDLVVRHDNDLWEVRGRNDDVLKILGRRVGPSEIEDALLSDGRVATAAAIGVLLGERLSDLSTLENPTALERLRAFAELQGTNS